MNYTTKLLLVSTALFFSCSVLASGKYQMRPIEKFNRCYNRLVRKPLPVSGTSKGYTLSQQVSRGEISATNACIALINHAALDANGVLVNRNDSEARDILETLHNFHNSFFAGPALSFLNGYQDMTMLMKDLDEPALYFTRALFRGGIPVSNVLTASVSLRSVRESNFQGANKNFETRSIVPPHHAEVSAKFADPRVLLVSERNLSNQLSLADAIRPTFEGLFQTAMDQATASGDSAQVTAVTNKINGYVNTYKTQKSQVLSDTEFVGQGRILGVRLQTGLNVPVFGTSYNGVPFVTSSFDNFKLHSHWGGGVLGSQMYYMKNTNLKEYTGMGGITNDPYSAVPRRFTSRIYTDLLCHTLPTLREADIRAEIDASSAHSFKTTSSCVRCHASFDDLGGLYRNVIVVRTASRRVGTLPEDVVLKEVGNPMIAAMQFRIPESARTDTKLVGGKSIADRVRDTFALQSPTGRLWYRDHAGTVMRSDNISSIAQLGSILADGDDFYRCLAKRYYHFFTGVDVNLTAPWNELDDAGKYHKSVVYNLGRILRGRPADLKNDTERADKQSMKAMIRRILNTKPFESRDFGITGQ